MKKERSSGHPSEHDWLVGGVFPKIEWSYVSDPKALWSPQQVVEIDAEGEV